MITSAGFSCVRQCESELSIQEILIKKDKACICNDHYAEQVRKGTTLSYGAIKAEVKRKTDAEFSHTQQDLPKKKYTRWNNT